LKLFGGFFSRTTAFPAVYKNLLSQIRQSTVTIVGAGSATITASQTANDNYNAATDVTITLTVNVAVTGITLNKATLALTVEGSESLTATLAPETATNKNLTWSSSDVNIATVDANGLLTAVAAGTVIITVTTTHGGKTATCAVTVTAGTNGLWDVRNNTSLKLSGNPVQDSEAVLTFTEAGDGGIIRITDLAGKTVLQQAVATGSTAASMSVVGLSKGIYLVKYTDNEGKLATVKMIK